MNYKKQNIYGHLDLLGVVWGTSWGVWGSIWAPCWLHVGSMLPPCWLLVVPHLGHLGPGSPRAPKSEKKIKFHASRAMIRKNSIGKKYGTRTWVCAPPKRECIFVRKMLSRLSKNRVCAHRCSKRLKGEHFVQKQAKRVGMSEGEHKSRK